MEIFKHIKLYNEFQCTHYTSSTIINIGHSCFILLTSPHPALPHHTPQPVKKKIVVKYSPWYLLGIGSRMPMDTKIHRCSNPLHRWCSSVGLCIRGFYICGFNQPQMKFSLHLVQSADTEGQQCTYIKSGLFLAWYLIHKYFRMLSDTDFLKSNCLPFLYRTILIVC